MSQIKAYGFVLHVVAPLYHTTGYIIAPHVSFLQADDSQGGIQFATFNFYPCQNEPPIATKIAYLCGIAQNQSNENQ